MKAKSMTIAAAAASVLVISVIPAAGAAPIAKKKTCGNDNGRGLEAVALTDDNRLLCLDVSDPGDARNIGKVKNLQGDDDELIGIDFSAENKKLYGVGDGGGIYTINLRNAKAKLVSTMSVVPEGESFGVDFNPTSNALRVISDTGQNLRVAPIADGTTVEDGELTNPAVPPAEAQTATGVTAAAYTNTDKVSKADTGTTLFDIDTDADRVAIQAPANNGTLNPTGKLGRNAASETGFDIYSFIRGGEARRNVAYAALSNGNRSSLYKVDLLDGSLNRIGKFDKDRGDIIGLALPINQD